MSSQMALSILAVVLIMSGAAVSTCVTKTLPPEPYYQSFATANAKFADAIVPLDDSTIAAVTYGLIVQTDPHQVQGGILVMRRPSDPAPFEFVQFIGNGTNSIYSITGVVGSNNQLLVAAGAQTSTAVVVYSMFEIDSVTSEYVFLQSLAAPNEAEAPFTTGANGKSNQMMTMCTSWAFASFYIDTINEDPSNHSLRSFAKDEDTGEWVAQGEVLTYKTGASNRIQVSKDCSVLAVLVNEPDYPSYTATRLSIYKYNNAHKNWAEIQRIQTSTDLGQIDTLAITSTHLVVGMIYQTYVDPITEVATELAGTVAVYAWNGTHYSLSQTQLSQPPGHTTSYGFFQGKCGFSLDVSLDGKDLIVGCPWFNTTASFAAQCLEYPELCNTTACVNALVNSFFSQDEAIMLAEWFSTFIRGMAPVYRLNSTTNHFDHVNTLSEVCNSSLPFQCVGPPWGSGGGFGQSVAISGNHTLVSDQMDWIVGQIYDHVDAVACGRCVCKQEHPCLNGGVCHDTFVSPYFECQCPSNFTGPVCGQFVPPAPPAPGPASSDAAATGASTGAIAAVGVVVVILLAVLASTAPAAAAGGGSAAAAGAATAYPLA
jgi:hypothetical protein